MLGSRFFWKLYLTFSGLVLITLTVTGFLVHRQLRNTLLTDVETRLRVAAVSLLPYSAEVFQRLDGEKITAYDGDEITPSDGEKVTANDNGTRYDPALQEEIAQLGRQTDTRITLIAPDGLVLADSDHDPQTMDNHGTRPEVLDARTNPYGVSRRFSTTLDELRVYVAIATRDEDGRFVGTVRTSVSLAAVEARLAALRNTIAFGAALGMLIALGAGLEVARRITAPVTQMTEVAEALRAGRYERRVAHTGDDEIGLLGATINRLVDELTRRIATLAEQRAQLDAMVSGLQEGVFAVDEGDRPIFNNTAAERLLLLGDADSEASVWETVAAPGLKQLCADARDANGSAQSEITLRRDGNEVVLDARATAFDSEGERGVVMVLYDVTNLRRLERMRTDFVANVSHELKTPLTSIRGYVETLIGGAIHDDANNLRFLGKIEQQVDRLSAMVSDVLSLARIEAAKPQVAAHPVDWRPVVESVVERYRDAGKLGLHECAVELADEAVSIEGDVESMTQILDNLLDNAVKYTPKGGRITIRAVCRNGHAVLEVEDTGIGMSIADRERIFERFFRADRARSRDTGGTGLGLAIVKHLAQNLGGEVRVTSELGKGSRFAVWAPSVRPS